MRRGTIADRHHLHKPVVEQPQYNLFWRDRVEKEYAPLYDGIGLGLTTWSPLSSGLLTGKYLDGVPEGSRATLPGYEWLADLLTDPERNEKVRGLRSIAEELDCTLAQLAIAWCAKNPHVSSVITGASRVEQVHENLGALDVLAKLTDDVMARIDKITPAERGRPLHGRRPSSSGGLGLGGLGRRVVRSAPVRRHRSARRGMPTWARSSTRRLTERARYREKTAAGSSTRSGQHQGFEELGPVGRSGDVEPGVHEEERGRGGGRELDPRVHPEGHVGGAGDGEDQDACRIRPTPPGSAGRTAAGQGGGQIDDPREQDHGRSRVEPGHPPGPPSALRCVTCSGPSGPGGRSGRVRRPLTGSAYGPDRLADRGRQRRRELSRDSSRSEPRSERRHLQGLLGGDPHHRGDPVSRRRRQPSDQDWVSSARLSWRICSSWSTASGSATGIMASTRRSRLRRRRSADPM